MIVERREQDETLNNCCNFSIKETCKTIGMQSSVSSIELLNDSLANNSFLVDELNNKLENAHHQIVQMQREYEMHLLQVHHQHEIELLKKDHTIELLQRDLSYLSSKLPLNGEDKRKEEPNNQVEPNKNEIGSLTKDIETLQMHIQKLLKHH